MLMFHTIQKIVHPFCPCEITVESIRKYMEGLASPLDNSSNHADFTGVADSSCPLHYLGISLMELINSPRGMAGHIRSTIFAVW